MRGREKNALTIIIALTTAAVATISAFSNDGQVAQHAEDRQQTQEQKKTEIESQFPVAKYSAAESVDVNKRERGASKGGNIIKL